MKELLDFEFIILGRLAVQFVVYWEWGEIGSMLRLPRRKVPSFGLSLCLCCLNFEIVIQWGKA